MSRELAEAVLTDLKSSNTYFFRPSSQPGQYVMSYLDSEKKIHHVPFPYSSDPDKIPTKYGLEPKNALILEFQEQSLLKLFEKDLFVPDSITSVDISANFYTFVEPISISNHKLYISGDIISFSNHDIVVLFLLLIGKHKLIQIVNFDYFWGFDAKHIVSYFIKHSECSRMHMSIINVTDVAAAYLEFLKFLQKFGNLEKISNKGIFKTSH